MMALDKSLNSMFIHLSDYHLWDVAGVDGMQFFRALFGETIVKIAPFQFRETAFERSCCYVLRLCELYLSTP